MKSLLLRRTSRARLSTESNFEGRQIHVTMACASWLGEPAQGNHLLFLLFVQDIAHVTEGLPRQLQCPGSAISLAGFQVSTYGRFWVSPKVEKRLLCRIRVGVDELLVSGALEETGAENLDSGSETVSEEPPQVS